MNPVFAASIFPTDTATTFTSALTTTVSDNIGVVLAIVAVVFGINFARKMLNRGLKGRV